MAIIRVTPYMVGEGVNLWPTDEQAEWVHISAPDGQEMQLKRIPPGPVLVEVRQPGEWCYRWESGEEGTLDVVAPPTEPEAAPEPPAPTRWQPGG